MNRPVGPSENVERLRAIAVAAEAEAYRLYLIAPFDESDPENEDAEDRALFEDYEVAEQAVCRAWSAFTTARLGEAL